MPTAFTSVTNGNWNDGATWGLTSPGVKGTDWPGLAGDTFTVVVGHTVTYNVSETNELGGDNTINGLLTFSTGANTKMVLANAKRIVVANGGELRIGTTGAVIDAANTAELYWNESADDADALLLNAGGKLTIAGDPTYYGSDDETTLSDNVENTDGDDVIKTADDMSALWNVGDEICIHIKTSYANYNTDVILRTISSFNGVDGTLITVTGGNVTTDAGCTGKVINVTRNVKIGKLNAVTTIGNYNASTRPGIDDNNTVSGNVNISNSTFIGIYAIDSRVSSIFSNITIRNSGNAFISCISSIISGNIFSNNYSFNIICTSLSVSGNIFSNNYGFGSCNNCSVSSDIFSNNYSTYGGDFINISGNIFSNNYACYYTRSYIISGNIYGNSYGLFASSNNILTGKIGYDSLDNSIPNTNDIAFPFFDNFFRNVKLPLAGLVFDPTYRNVVGSYGKVKCEHHDRVINAHKIYAMFGDIIKVFADGTSGRPSVDPDGGTGDLVELSNVQSNCGYGGRNQLRAFEHLVWATTSLSKTYTYKVQTTYVGITAGNLKLTGEYLDEGSGGHITTTTNAPAINERTGDTDWTQSLAVTINPAQTGWVRLKIELFEYESGKAIWIYPKPTIA